MPISPWPSGQTKRMTFEVYDDHGDLADLSGLTASQLSFQVYNTNHTSLLYTGTGVFQIPPANKGIIYYFPSPADSATPGYYLIRVKASASPGSTDYLPWEVQL